MVFPDEFRLPAPCVFSKMGPPTRHAEIQIEEGEFLHFREADGLRA
jgi:hypothetical protein